MTRATYARVKRTIDVCLSCALLVLLAPVLCLFVLAVKIESRGPAIYRSVRVGRGGIPFTLYKIRTMYYPSPRGFVVDKDPRVTKMGRVLRRISVDELPQLYNVLRGDMSLIGPRPDILSNYVTYDLLTKKRLDVRPGLTGLAQVRGRNRIPWAERYRYDIQYVDSIGPALDAAIALQTVRQMLLMRDINVGS